MQSGKRREGNGRLRRLCIKSESEARIIASRGLAEFDRASVNFQMKERIKLIG
jgi:hypothetical protein